MGDPLMNTWLQYIHLEKLYGYLPGLEPSIPGIVGLTTEEYREVVGAFREDARDAARDLLTDEGTASLVDRLPFRRGQTVLAVGDSITDDLRSWAEMLRHLLDLRRGDEGIEVVNGGLSAHTTAMILRRWPATLAAKPDWIICALGGNDVTRVGPGDAKLQVSLSESVANLLELRRVADALTDCSWVWMTPVPVLEERVDAHPAFRYGLSSWRNDDITALSDAIRSFEDPAVDLCRTFGVPPDPDLQGPDGLHVSVAGQRAIVTALLRGLVE